MDWSKLISGGDHAPSGWVLLAVICSGAVLLAYAGEIDFIAARWLMWFAVVPASFAGVVGARWGRWLIPRNEALRGVVGADRGCFSGMILFAIAALFAWFVLVRVLCGGITRLTGYTTVLPPIRMSLWYRTKHRSCPTYLQGGPVEQFGQGALCPSKSQLAGYRGIPEGTRADPPRYSFGVQLTGLQGPFGFYITSFKRVSNPQSREDISNKGGGFDYGEFNSEVHHPKR